MLEQLLAPSAKLRYPTYHTEAEQGAVLGSCCMADLQGTLPTCRGSRARGG